QKAAVSCAPPVHSDCIAIRVVRRSTFTSLAISLSRSMFHLSHKFDLFTQQRFASVQPPLYRGNRHPQERRNTLERHLVQKPKPERRRVIGRQTIQRQFLPVAIVRYERARQRGDPFEQYFVQRNVPGRARLFTLPEPQRVVARDYAEPGCKLSRLLYRGHRFERKKQGLLRNVLRVLAPYYRLRGPDRGRPVPSCQLVERLQVPEYGRDHQDFIAWFVHRCHKTILLPYLYRYKRGAEG